EITAHRRQTAAGKLLAVDQRIARNLTLDFREGLETRRQIVLVRQIAAEVDEVSIRLEAVEIETLRRAAHAARMKRDAEVRRGDRTSRRVRRRVVGAEGIVVDWRRHHLTGDGYVLIEMLVIEPERYRMIKVR